MKTRWVGLTRTIALVVLVPFLVASCAPMVVGPSMPVFTGQGRSAIEFERDRSQCHAQAMADAERVQDAANANAALMILGAAALGAGLGAATGGGRGAGIGAAAGGVAGGAFGAAGASSASGPAQRAYDTTYFSCMYNRGHQVPGVAPAAQQQAPRAAPMPPPPPSPQASSGPTYTSPPPSGSPPAAGAPCKPSGKYVRTPQGTFAEICE